MSLWEYKVITSGKGGFASPTLLEKFLNDLGREEWEIVEFQPQPDNFMAFTGLARRPTQRDWTLEDAAAAAAKAEAEKLRAEFEAKFRAATSGAAGSEDAPASFLEEKIAADDGFRRPIDTSHDADAEDDERKADEDDWDALTAKEQDELPTFFDAIKPHMRRNQRGPGMSVGVDYLAKKWDQSEEDLKGALVECGFTMPEDEDDKPVYLEFEGDLYWINVNRRGELWINAKEKPRPVFRTVKAERVTPVEEAKPERKDRKGESERQHAATEKRQAISVEPAGAGPESAAAPEVEAAPAGPAQPELPAKPLPTGPALLDAIRPLMRRNRRGPGGSGSASFLSRALKCGESDLIAGFKALGLVVPSSASEKATNVEIGNSIWWINIDSRGNIWINGRERKASESTAAGPATAAASLESPPVAPAPQAVSPGESIQRPVESAAPAIPPTEPAPDEPASPAGASENVPAPEAAPTVGPIATSPEPAGAPAVPEAAGVLPSLRPLLKPSRMGGLSAKLERVAEETQQTPEQLLARLVEAGLGVPERPREKASSVERGDETYWLSRTTKGEIWLNAKGEKSAQPADGPPGADSGEPSGEKKPRRPRTRRKPDATEGGADLPPA